MELWKNIPNHPGYQASSLGRIRSFWGKGNNPQILKKSHLRTPTITYGYKVVNITDANKKQRTLPVHRLVLSAFKGASNGLYGLHKNDIRIDNKIENLYWGSQKQNIDDQKRNGKFLYGDKCPWKKLDSKQIEEIKDKFVFGSSVIQLSREYNVSHSLISMILHGKRWKAPRLLNV